MAAEEFFTKNIGRCETVLAEEIYDEKLLLTGYTGNYIKVYIKINNEEDGKKLLNRFIKVRLNGICEDGMTAEITDSTIL